MTKDQIRRERDRLQAVLDTYDQTSLAAQADDAEGIAPVADRHPGLRQRVAELTRKLDGDILSY